MSNPIPVSIQILDREYRLSCLPEEEQELKNSAQYIDQKLRKLKEESRLPIEQVAIVAALNIAHELLMHQDTVAKSTRLTEARLTALSNLLSDNS